MKRTYVLPLILSVCLATSCGEKSKKKATSQTDKSLSENPFMKPSTLPYGAPNFDVITNKDFAPAIEAGIAKKLKEIKAIADNSEAPTFENTLVALEKSGQDLSRVLNVFYLLTGANTNDTLQKVEEDVAPKLAALSDAVYLNDKLFQRVKTIYNSLDKLDLDPESKRLAEYYYQQFVLSGANLPADKKVELKKVNGKIAKLMTEFSNTLLAAAQKSALIVDNAQKLDGLSEAQIDYAARKAKEHDHDGKYELPLQNTTQQPALQNLNNRKVREELFEHSVDRAEQGGDTDTRKVVIALAEARADKAAILGYDNYAAWNLQDQMAKTPEAVEEFLSKIVPAATQKAKDEAAEIQKLITKSGEDFELEAYDWNYYAEKVRQAKYDLNEDQIKPYFVLDSVLENGVFYAANQLYGLTFKQRTDIPVYQDDVKVYEVFDKDGTTQGLFYADFFKRDNKGGGAWMSNIVNQSFLLDKKPVIYNVCNFPKPAEGQPALISFDDVTTMFHEFGHALHGFFANQKYPSLSGTAVARDFVEFPSQFNEHWALYPSILKNYAKHYKTGEVIPEELVAKIKKASTFNQGYMMTELLASAQLDMQWHMISADKDVKSVDDFEEKALEHTHLDLDQVPPRYRSSYFQHIWGNGYAAGYYAYIWTEMLDDDAYSWFKENGGLTRENGQRFRDMILSKGNTEDYNTLFKAFRGHAPNITPMLEDRGLIEK